MMTLALIVRIYTVPKMRDSVRKFSSKKNGDSNSITFTNPRRKKILNLTKTEKNNAIKRGIVNKKLCKNLRINRKLQKSQSDTPLKISLHSSIVPYLAASLNFLDS